MQIWIRAHDKLPILLRSALSYRDYMALNYKGRMTTVKRRTRRNSTTAMSGRRIGQEGEDKDEEDDKEEGRQGVGGQQEAGGR